MKPAPALLFAIESCMAPIGNPQPATERRPDARGLLRVAPRRGAIARAPRQLTRRGVGAKRVGRFLRRPAAAKPDRVRGPDIHKTLVESVVVRVEARAEPLEVQLQRRPEPGLKRGVAGPLPRVDQLVKELRLHVVDALAPEDATPAIET